MLRLAEPIRIDHTPKAGLAAVHFGWMKGKQGRRVATIARSAEPAVALQIARDHGAVVMEPLDLRAAGKAVDETSGQ